MKKPTIEAIQKITAKKLGSPLDMMWGESRRRIYVRPRQIAMYVAGRFDYSTTAVGIVFGNRDHTTVLHAYRTIENDPELRHTAETIIAGILDAPEPPPIPKADAPADVPANRRRMFDAWDWHEKPVWDWNPYVAKRREIFQERHG